MLLLFIPQIFLYSVASVLFFFKGMYRSNCCYPETFVYYKQLKEFFLALCVIQSR